MRTTWVILLVMIIAGTGMYYYFSRKQPPGKYDTISLGKTPDSIVKKTKIFIADNPIEIFYRDSTWQNNDSTPLRTVLDGIRTDSMDKGYSERTIFLSYDNRQFYDMEIKKPDSLIAYDIHFELSARQDTLILIGTIDQKEKGVIRFSNPMVKMYHSFVLTYNNKLPDSLRNDSSKQAGVPQASKTITVLEN